MTLYTKKTATELQATVTAVYTTAYGDNFNLDTATTNGVLIQQQTNALTSVEASKTEIYGSLYNPNYSFDRYLDAVRAFSNVHRNSATYTRVECQLTGIEGTYLASGTARALSTNGDEFTNVDNVTLSAGVTTTTFRAVNTGVIPAPIGSVNRVIQQIIGWDTINNVGEGVVGTVKETDSAYRTRSKQALYSTSFGMLNSLISALFNLTGVVDFNVLENYTSTDDTSGAVTILAHSIYVCVYAPTIPETTIGNNLIGTVIVQKKSPGCNMTGTIEGTIQDPEYSWQTYPYKFDRAIETPLKIILTIGNSTAYSQSIITDLQTAIVNRFYSVDTSPLVEMGVTIFIGWFTSVVNALNVYDIRVFTLGTLLGSQDISLLLPINQVGTLIADNVIVTLV